MPPKRPNRIEVDGEIAYIYARKAGKEVPFIVDAEDVALISDFTWFVSKNGYACYRGHVRHKILPYCFYLHRFLLNRAYVKDGYYVDHINRNPLDNRRCNLRLVTCTQNAQNCAAKARNGIRGARFNRILNLYMAGCNHHGKRKFLGWFKTPEEAHHVTMTYLHQHDLIPT